MKDVYQVFDDGFQNISRFDETGFKNCFYIAADMTRIATYLDFKQGVLVAEVLEGIFSQVGPLFEYYVIPNDDKKRIKDKIDQGVALLSSAYKNDDMAKLCEILTDLRFAATSFQLKSFTHWKQVKKDRPEFSGDSV